MGFSVLRARKESPLERRRHVRYQVEGSVALHSGRQWYNGVPANLSLGGILFTADPVPPDGTAAMMQLEVEGFSETIFAEVRIIRTYKELTAAIFLRPPDTLARCIEWLAGKEAKGA